jgi:hypothetical protein
MPGLIIRCTHTGVYQDGRPNTNPVFINDLDTGLEQQRRKVPCYVPVGGFIDIPASSRSMLSFYNGTINKFTIAGVITSSFISTIPSQPESYNNTNRPNAALYTAGTGIWNTDDNAMNWSDGNGNWRNANGQIT